MLIRLETPDDIAAIRTVTQAAFESTTYGLQTEVRIVDALRAAGAMTLSLVAVEGGEVIGHAGFSPVSIGGEAGRWFGLGPVSVLPARHRSGVGQALTATGSIGCGLRARRAASSLATRPSTAASASTSIPSSITAKDRRNISGGWCWAVPRRRAR
jgi:putative acetyltransferase